MVQPGDVGLAACGNFEALRRLRNHWWALAAGELVNPLLPKEDALPQLELLAEMAVAAIDQPDDWIVLLATSQIRVAALERDLGAAEDMAKQAVAADDTDLVVRWTNSVVEFEERLKRYRSKIDELLQHIIGSNQVEGTAMLAAALSHQADIGDERAVPLLERLMSLVTPERAQAINNEVRKMEAAGQ